MADLGFSIALEGVSQFLADLNKISAESGKAAQESQQKLGGISDYFVQSLKQSAPLVGRAVEALTNPMQALVQIGADLAGSLSEWVGEADKAAVVEAQLTARIKSTGGAAGLTQKQLINMAEGLSQVSRFEDDAIKSSEALLLTFTNIGKKEFPRAEQAILDLATAMGSDLQSATLQLGKALNDPVGAIGALSRAGVQFTDSQKSLIQSFVDTNQIAKAQDVILTELEKQVGGAAKAAADAGSGPWQLMKKSLGEVAEQAGGLLIPVLNGLAYVLSPLISILAECVNAFGALGATIGFLVGGPIGALVGLLAGGLVNALWGAISATDEYNAATDESVVALKKEQRELTTQISKLGDSTVSTHGKADAIARINKIQPELLKGLDAQNLSEAELNGLMEKVNETYAKRIDLMIRQGRVSFLIEKQKEALKVFLEAEEAGLAAQKRLQEAGQNINELFGDNKGLNSIAKLTYGLANMGDVADALVLENARAELEDLEKQLDAAREATKFDDAANAFNEAMNRIAGTRATEDQLKAAGKAFGDISKEAERAAKMLENVRFPAFSSSSDLAQRTLELLEEIEPTATTAFDGMHKSLEASNTEIKGMAENTDLFIEKLKQPFEEGVLDRMYVAIYDLRQQFRQLGQDIKTVAIDALGNLAFNMGEAIALGKDLGDVFKEAVSQLLSTVGKMIGMTLIHSALGAPFPLSLGLLAAGLAVLGLSGLLSGALKPKDKSADSVPDLAEQNQQASSPANPPGLSAFNQSPVVPTFKFDGDVTLDVDGYQMDGYLTSRDRKNKRNSGN